MRYWRCLGVTISTLTVFFLDPLHCRRKSLKTLICLFLKLFHCYFIKKLCTVNPSSENGSVIMLGSIGWICDTTRWRCRHQLTESIGVAGCKQMKPPLCAKELFLLSAQQEKSLNSATYTTVKCDKLEINLQYPNSCYNNDFLIINNDQLK